MITPVEILNDEYSHPTKSKIRCILPKQKKKQIK